MRDWSTQVEIHIVSLLEWKGFNQHKLRYIIRWHGKNHILSYSWQDASLVNSCLVTHSVFAGMGRVSSTHVEMHYVHFFGRGFFDGS